MLEERAWLEISRSAIAHNLEQIRKKLGKTKIMGVVKADAYGHGAIESTRILKENGVDFFAVATLEEGIELRRAGIEEDILIFGYTHPALFDQLVNYNLIQSGLSLDYLKKMAEFPEPIRTHIKLDTGMNRTGLRYDDSDQARKELLEAFRLEGILIEGIFSHMAVSDENARPSREFTRQQIETFKNALSFLEDRGIDYGLSHMQNSYGIANYGDLGFDYARPGLLWMGLGQGSEYPIANMDLIPALSLKARIAMIADLQPGDTVSYGRNYTSDKPGQLAVMTIGYADGLHRACSNKGMVVLAGATEVPVIGNICMDQAMIDVSGLALQEGDEVVLAGRQGDQFLSLDQISDLAGTINNETLSRFSTRLKRIYTD